MDVSDEAKRIMVAAVEKLKNSRAQRGGLRLHRTLLLTLAIRSARDLFYTAQTLMGTRMTAEPSHAPAGHLCSSSSSAGEEVAPPPGDPGSVGGDLNLSSSVQPPRKRGANAAAEPHFLPCKKARLEPDWVASPG